MSLTRTAGNIFTSPTFRALTLGFLSLLLLIPLGSVHRLITERQGLRAAAAASIAAGWGGAQTVLGPVLVLELACDWKDTDGKVQELRRLATRLPATLDIDGISKTETRRRGLHVLPIYRATLKTRFSIDMSADGLLESECDGARLRAASIALAVTDPRGIDRLSALSVDGRSIEWIPGNPLGSEWATGVQAPLPVAMLAGASGRIALSFELELRGSDRLAIAPSGGQTTVHLRSDWRSPSFDGAFLPATSDLRDDGFDAAWTVSELARPLPSLSLGDPPSALAAAAFGVTWFQPADSYLMTERSLKYGFLFIFLTFLTFFLFEQSGTRRVHPLQYGLVGGALAVFFLLLLSLTERIGFGVAYFVAAAATTAQVTLYGRALLESGRRVFVLAAVVGTLYLGLFLLVGLEETALLAGSIALFGVLAIAMWLTRDLGRSLAADPAGPPPAAGGAALRL
ncbi:MAG: cell envelope integrity protein CreD [Thermoanaerobaculia bacterium]